LFALLSVAPAKAITIRTIFDGSVTNLGNAADVEAAINYAAETIGSLYSNQTMVNLKAYWGAVGPFSNGVSLGARRGSDAFGGGFDRA
jgi:hypothetical protein